MSDELDDGYGGTLQRKCEEQMARETAPFPKLLHVEVSGIEREVCADIAMRHELGIQKFTDHMTVKQTLQWAYESTIDSAVVLKRAIKELEQEAK